jgi:hypothetical protein
MRVIVWRNRPSSEVEQGIRTPRDPGRQKADMRPERAIVARLGPEATVAEGQEYAHLDRAKLRTAETEPLKQLEPLGARKLEDRRSAGEGEEHRAAGPSEKSHAPVVRGGDVGSADRD